MTLADRTRLEAEVAGGALSIAYAAVIGERERCVARGDSGGALTTHFAAEWIRRHALEQGCEITGPDEKKDGERYKAILL